MVKMSRFDVDVKLSEQHWGLFVATCITWDCIFSMIGSPAITSNMCFSSFINSVKLDSHLVSTYNMRAITSVEVQLADQSYSMCSTRSALYIRSVFVVGFGTAIIVDDSCLFGSYQILFSNSLCQESRVYIQTNRHHQSLRPKAMAERLVEGKRMRVIEEGIVLQCVCSVCKAPVY